LRAAHHLNAGEQIAGQQLEPRLVAGGWIIEADAVDEQQGVTGLGAADAQLRLGAAWPGRRYGYARREPEQVRRAGQIERLDPRLVQHGRGDGRGGFRDGLPGAGDDDVGVGVGLGGRHGEK
jgi:hypothetical protein